MSQNLKLQINDLKKTGIVWALLMIGLLATVFVLQYMDTHKWTEAIKPVMFIVAFGSLLKTFADLYNFIASRHRFNAWSITAFCAATSCLTVLWILGGNIKGLLFIIGLALMLFLIVLLANWLKIRIGR